MTIVFITAFYTNRHKILRSLSKRADGTAYTGRPAVEDMGVNHRRLDDVVAKGLLHPPNIGTVRRQLGGERMAEGGTRHACGGGTEGPGGVDRRASAHARPLSRCDAIVALEAPPDATMLTRLEFDSAPEPTVYTVQPAFANKFSHGPCIQGGRSRIHRVVDN